MYRELGQAFIGKLQWNLFSGNHPADRYLFMPHQQDDYNDYTLQYLPAYLEKERASSACIITCDSGVYEKVRKTSWPDKYQVRAVLERKAWIARIVRFYGLYEFSTRVKIISLTEPYDTCGENLLGMHGVTKKELCCYDILGFSQIPGE